MQLSRCLGTLQLLPIQHLLLQLLDGLKQHSSEELDPQPCCCTTLLPWSWAAALAKHRQIPQC